MKIRKIISLLLVAVITVSFSACKDNADDVIAETTTQLADVTTTELVSENVSEEITFVADETTTVAETTTAESTTVNADDPSGWSKSKIVSFYKKAANNSGSVTSSQVMTLADVVINNGEGTINSVLKFVKPIITKVLQSSSTDFEGITGGHQNILDSDIATAKAYASGENTVIEMTMYEQVDGARGDRYSGTVGHAISVVGDISEVFQMLEDAGISGTVADEDVTLTYTKPAMKVLVGKDGKIINGTWTYTVDIDLRNFTVRSKTVEKASAVIEYEITVNGGFKV
ncbi:MAG: hypothetical protein IKV76_10565 [Clostridia bacterium]|nr:hypothetical protein [Clostridia bacterium]